MLTGEGHIKIIDFGTAYFFKTDLMNIELLDKISKIKQHENEEDQIAEYQSKHKATFVGTAEFLFNSNKYFSITINIDMLLQNY